MAENRTAARALLLEERFSGEAIDALRAAADGGSTQVVPGIHATRLSLDREGMRRRAAEHDIDVAIDLLLGNKLITVAKRGMG